MCATCCFKEAYCLNIYRGTHTLNIPTVICKCIFEFLPREYIKTYKLYRYPQGCTYIHNIYKTISRKFAVPGKEIKLCPTTSLQPNGQFMTTTMRPIGFLSITFVFSTLIAPKNELTIFLLRNALSSFAHKVVFDASAAADDF